MSNFDPIELAIFKSATRSIAEEMGAVLRRTAFSPNIKERRDYSCAVFHSDGQVIAMGDHMPVHLGSMPMSVQAAMDALTLESGDIAILNFEAELFEGQDALFLVRMVKAGPRWVFDRATKAGLIDK